jgi:transposase
MMVLLFRKGVSRDRIPSVHDPEMRHGRKSSSVRFDGHKGAVAVDSDSQLITAVGVLPGNAWDGVNAMELVKQSEENTGVEVEEAIGDAA